MVRGRWRGFPDQMELVLGGGAEVDPGQWRIFARDSVAVLPWVRLYWGMRF
jgi:hypothetical protein